MAEPPNPQIVASKPKRLTRVLSRALPRNYEQSPLAHHGLKAVEAAPEDERHE